MDWRKDVEAKPKDGVMVTFPEDDGWSSLKMEPTNLMWC
jgi:hypothetical protein